MKRRTIDAHRQRIFKSRNNGSKNRIDDVERPELKVVAVCQGKAEITDTSHAVLTHVLLCRRCAWSSPILTGLTEATTW
jgi:hypothetical protein